MMFRRRRLTCQQVVELVTEYLDGAMEPRRRARFEEHLAGCDGCTAYLEQVRTTVTLVGRLDVGDVPGPVMSELLSAFRTWADDRSEP
jgi:anti-sigma factor RsiW